MSCLLSQLPSLRTVLLCAAALCVAAIGSHGQITAQDQEEQDQEEDLIRTNIPTEIEVKALVDYVSERLEVQILYDEAIADKKINILSPGGIPADSLLAVLQSALRMKGLTLVDADAPGWKRIVEETRLPEVSIAEDAAIAMERLGGATAVTQAFVLEHVDPSQLETTIEPFLSPQGANTVALAEQGVLIVTDYASNLVKLARLIEMIDRPRPMLQTEFVELEHTTAASIADQISAMIEARNTAQGVSAEQGAGVAVFAESRTNQVIIVGEQRLVEQVREFARVLDVPLGTSTEVYTLTGVSAERVDRLVRNLLPAQDVDRLYQSAVDSDQNLLIVTATEEIHQRVRQMTERLDVAADAERTSRIRFHKLKYITATAALETLRSIEQSSQPTFPGTEPQTDGRFRFRGDEFLPGPNFPQLGPQAEPIPPPALREEEGMPLEIDEFGQAEPQMPPGLFSAGRANVTADFTSNTLIVVADPIVQQVYAELIETLDQPRPQVLIEAKIVILDTSDDFALGVEVSGGDRNGIKRLFAFSSFGLSDVDPITGALTIIPGLGFNGTLVDPDTADVVLRAFTTHNRSKVVSAPRLVVNDNATGQLSSVTEVPFTSVNASQTVATTSFAGFADAGTTITVTPHISDDDELQLKYRITLNEFQGQVSSEGVPPPRQTDEIESEVRIPDGHTLIVGGLNRKNYSHDTDSIPYLELIPILRHAVSNYSEMGRETSLFVFLRPIILRDDKFRDLKYYSERDTARSGIPGDYPESRPMLIR